MAKICKQCGVKYSNSATKCIMCGTEFNDVHIYAKRKKRIILGIVGLILAVVAVAFIILSTGPKAAVRRMMDWHITNNADAVIESLPDFLMESEHLDSGAFAMEVTATVNTLSSYIRSYNVEKAETPSTMEQEELMEAFRYFAGDGFDESAIEDIKTVWVNYKIRISGFWQSRATRFTMIKYEGKWCWWPDNVNR